MNRSEMDKALLKEGLRSKKKVPKMAPVSTPSAPEREFFKEMRKILAEISAEYLSALKTMAPMAKELSDSMRMDAGEKDIIALLNKIRLKMGDKYTREELEKVINKNLRNIKKYNDGATKKLFSRVTGVDLFLDDGPLETIMGLATANNVNLIQTLIQESQAKVENIIYDGYRTGLRHEEVAKQVKKYIDPNNEHVKGNVAYRARFIARDQTSKLNAQITQTRQQSLGIKRYIWRTSGDERVRDSHRALDGEEFSWSKPPAVGHPGEDFNCRCTAEPVLDDLIED